MNVLQGDNASQSSDVSRRLDEGAADRSDGQDETIILTSTPAAQAIPPVDSSVSGQSRDAPSSPSLWKRLSGLAGGGREHVTTRPLARETAQTLSPVRELDLQRSPVLSPRAQLEQIRMDTELMELSCRRAAAQLEQLRIETETAELATRRTWAESGGLSACRQISFDDGLALPRIAGGPGRRGSGQRESLLLL
jgi:hypothetical protein